MGDFCVKFSKAFREGLKSMLLKVFHKIETEQTPLNLFHVDSYPDTQTTLRPNTKNEL